VLFRSRVAGALGRTPGTLFAEGA